jgi:hypothetical protein
MWLNKFFRLLYIAYLDCEGRIKSLALWVFGVAVGIALMFSISTLLSDGFFASDYAMEFLYFVLVMAIWDSMIIALGLLVFGALFLLGWSGIRVAYLYDNKDWGYVHAIRGFATSAKGSVVAFFDKLSRQLDNDKGVHNVMEAAHDAMIILEIKNLKERK